MSNKSKKGKASAASKAASGKGSKVAYTKNLHKSKDSKKKKQDLTLIPWSKLKRGSLLTAASKGKQANIYKGLYKENKVIIKEFTNDTSDDIFATHMYRELSSLVKLSHPHVVKFWGVSDPAPLALVCERMHTDMHQRVVATKELTDARKLVVLLHQVADGLAYVHKQKVLHRDMKPHNILLNEGDTLAKICDFGISQPADKDHPGGRQSGTIPFMAIEQLQDKSCGESSDVWSFGVTVWSIFAQDDPWRGYSREEILATYERGNRLSTSRTPGFLRDLCTSCWQARPASRPSMSAILRTFENEKRAGYNLTIERSDESDYSSSGGGYSDDYSDYSDYSDY